MKVENNDVDDALEFFRTMLDVVAQGTASRPKNNKRRKTNTNEVN